MQSIDRLLKALSEMWAALATTGIIIGTEAY